MERVHSDAAPLNGSSAGLTCGSLCLGRCSRLPHCTHDIRDYHIQVMRTAVSARIARRHPAAYEKSTDNALWRPEDSVGFRLKLALHAWTRQLDAALRPLGVTHVQFIALAAIEIFGERGETPSQVRIAAATQFDVMMISKILRRLESRGYIE